MKKVYIIILLIFATIAQMQAQGKFDAGLAIKNMHYWRGLRVSSGFVTAPTVGYYNGGFAAYAWGGMSVDGNYKEVSQIISYSTGGLSVTLLDIFNFTGIEKPEFFNYSKGETTHLIDLSVGYDFTENFPLTLMWATMIHGNDLDAEENNRYSTYFEASAPIDRNETTIAPFVALGFALRGNDENSLYTDGESFSVVNVGFSINKTAEIGTWKLPVSARLGYNPSFNEASIEIALQLF
jgi:hypothetical protein